MPLLAHLRNLARLDVNHWFNQGEEPGDLIGDRVRELEEGAVQAKNALVTFAVAYKRLEKEVLGLQKDSQDHLERAEKHLQNGDESAARTQLSRRLQLTDRLDKLLPVLESRRETYEELKASLVDIHNQLNQARSRMMEHQTRRPSLALNQKSLPLPSGESAGSLHDIRVDQELKSLQDKIQRSTGGE